MFEKLEIKINKMKKKINQQYLGIFMFMLFGAMTVFAMEMTNQFKRQKQMSQDQYNKQLYEMVAYVNNVSNDLAKAQITNTPTFLITTLSDIWRQANLAKQSLESLPVEQHAMENASKYLTQLGDYSYVLMKKSLTGAKLAEQEQTEMAQLYEESKKLNDIMRDIYNDLNSGRIKWDELKNIGNQELESLDSAQSVSSIEKIGKTFQKYEGLIYDGAFSDHLLSQTPKSLTENNLSQEQVQEKIVEIFGEENIETITFQQESSGRIELYDYMVKLKNEENKRNISMTKKDGKMYLMISDKKVTESKITINEAKQKGLEFLKKTGIENVVDTYYLVVENMAIINYAAKQEDVLLYPDLVKVKVSLDNGTVYSVESQGYIFNHCKRENLTLKISMKEAEKNVKENINIISKGLAIIPTESNGEILTYEFKGKIDEKEFIIYINATTGEEERILLIVDTPNGVLTM